MLLFHPLCPKSVSFVCCKLVQGRAANLLHGVGEFLKKTSSPRETVDKAQRGLGAMYMLYIKKKNCIHINQVVEVNPYLLSSILLGQCLGCEVTSRERDMILVGLHSRLSLRLQTKQLSL